MRNGIVILFVLIGILGGGVMGGLAVIKFTPQQELEIQKPGLPEGIAPQEIIQNSYNQVSPSVVHITSTFLARNFFMQLVPQEGVGSGILIDNDGYILTNRHVVENADFLRVVLKNGGEAYASLVGFSTVSDIAVIRVDPEGLDINPVPLGSSVGLSVGTQVLAIGNPFGLDNTASFGIVSALNRSVQDEKGQVLLNMIQTDTSINPGNSGGPLINMAGEVIGINTAIFSPTGGSVGIGFAIPINDAKIIMEEIIEEGKNRIPPPWLGVYGTTLTPQMSNLLGLSVEKGFMIFYVVPGSPASRADLRGGERQVVIGDRIIPYGGDIILKVNNQEIVKDADLRKALEKYKPGDEVIITYLRDNKIAQMEITLGNRA